MEQIKIKDLSERLLQIEKDVDNAIIEQLKRIGRSVKADEFDFIPVREDIQDYIEAIRLDGDNNPILETSFTDVKEKRLEAFIMEYEMSLDDLLCLLRILVNIPE